MNIDTTLDSGDVFSQAQFDNDKTAYCLTRCASLGDVYLILIAPPPIGSDTTYVPEKPQVNVEISRVIKESTHILLSGRVYGLF